MATESVCKEHNLEGRLVPVPRVLSAGCGIAFECNPILKDKLISIFKKEKTLNGKNVEKYGGKYEKKLEISFFDGVCLVVTACGKKEQMTQTTKPETKTTKAVTELNYGITSSPEGKFNFICKYTI